MYKIYDNYACSVVQIKAHIPLPKLDNLVHTSIFGNMVLVNKNTTPIGAIGLFFPLETKINHDFLSANNLYRNSELNSNKSIKGYFEDSGRVKATKFQGHKSMGFFIGLEALNYLNLVTPPVLGNEFNDIAGVNICKKYVIFKQETLNKEPKQPKSKMSKWLQNFRQSSESILIDNQVKLHYDTAQLGKNMHRIGLNDTLHITAKLHGTSAVSSYVLAKRKLNLVERFMAYLGYAVKDSEYTNIYTTRKTIKNGVLGQSPKQDEWFYANEYLKPYLEKGMTFYYELVGYKPNGGYIQNGYDYGCKQPQGEYLPNVHFKCYIYRISITNEDGRTFEFTPKQVQEFCLNNGLLAVPELWYGFANQLGHTQEEILSYLQVAYLEKDDPLCVNNVPDEGIVIKANNGLEAFKLKSFRFFERETKELDSGVSNDE